MSDPNTQRAIEQLAYVVGDVEQRINLVKAALSQVLVHPLAVRPGFGLERGMLPLLGGINPPHWNFLGTPVGLAPTIANANFLPNAGILPFPTVSSPLAIPNVGAGAFPFRV